MAEKKISKDYLWDHYSFFGENTKVQICDVKTNGERVDKAKCDISELVDFFYKDDGLMSATNDGIKLDLVKIDGKKYLTDNGAAFTRASRRGMSKNEFVHLLKSIHSEYDLALLGEDLCCEIKYPAMLLDCFRNMKSTIAKLGCMH